MKLSFPISPLFSRQLWALVGATFLASSAHAQFIPGFTLHRNPDINMQFLTLNYVASTDVLTVTQAGPAMTIRFVPNVPGPPTEPQYALVSPTLTFSANISAGGVLSSGTITITGGLAASAIDQGVITPYSFANGTTLITGNLTKFGYDNVGTAGNYVERFEFEFTRTGGALNALFPGNDTGRINLSGFSGAFPGNFNSNFNLTSGVGDVTIPEPSQFLGVFGVLLSTVLFRRRFSAAQQCHSPG